MFAKSPLATKGGYMDPALKDFLKLEAFQDRFSAHKFVENISGVLLSRSETKGEVFDPKPFKQTFEACVEELTKLKKTVSRKIEDLEDAYQASESARKKKMQELNYSFESAYAAFESLERRLGEVGNTAIRIGEQLESIDKQRSKASEARDLVNYFMDFNQNQHDRLDLVRDGLGKEGLKKVAVIARRLNDIAKEVDASGTETAKMNIEKYCEEIERSLLDKFDRAYKEGNLAEMAFCARVLYEFNGGQSSVQMYVNQHEFFTTRTRILLGSGPSPSKALTSTTATPGSVSANTSENAQPDTKLLVMLYADIRETVEKDWKLISAVFPNAANVMQVFLHRIFAQSVQSCLENLLDNARETRPLYYLRTLAAAHQLTVNLIQDIKKFDREHILPFFPPLPGTTPLSSTVDRSLEDLFIPYTEGERYIQLERKCLSERLDSLLVNFTNFVAQRKTNTANKRSVFSSKSSNTPTTNTPTMPTSTTASPISPQQQSPFGVATPTSPQSIVDTALTRLAETPTSELIPLIKGKPFSFLFPEELTILSLDVVTTMLSTQMESLQRAKSLSPLPLDLARNVAIVWDLFLDVLANKYLDGALTIASEELQFDAKLDKSEPDFRVLTVIHVCYQIVQLMQLYFQNAIVPLISSIPNFHRELAMQKTVFFVNFENKINAILQKYCDVVINYLTVTLVKQKKLDFKPKDDLQFDLTSTATVPCDLTTNFLRRLQNVVAICFDRDNSDMVLSEIGMAFHGQLLEHFKKFGVNETGAIVLTKDLQKYFDCVASFRIPSLTERFDFLKQLGNLFLVKPENLKTVINEGYLSRIDPQLLLPYLILRSDWSKFEKVEKDLFSKPQVNTNPTSPGGLMGTSGSADPMQTNLGVVIGSPVSGFNGGLMSPMTNSLG